MKLVLACIAVVLLASVIEVVRAQKYSFSEIYKYADISPVPECQLEVCFGDLDLKPGQKILPSEAIKLPTIKYDCEPGCYYTFAICNLDWPTTQNPFLSLSILGLYVNIYCDKSYGLQITESCEIATYIGPSPSAESKKPSRYILNVYKQSGSIDVSDKELTRLQYDRLGFSLEKFAKNYDLYGPVSGNFFLCEYPESYSKYYNTDSYN